MANVTEKDLRIEVNEMKDRFPKLGDDELFVAWFMKSFVTDTEDEGIAALVGGSKDKSLDAVFIDDASCKIFVIQGKYHQKISGTNEKRSDVVAFADLARSFSDDGEYRIYRQGLAVDAAGKADKARERIKSRSYRLQLYYVTTGKCSELLAKEAQSLVRRTSQIADIDIIDGKRVLRLLSDYLDGVAPPVPLLEIQLENGQGIKLSGILQRFDKQTKIESWVVPVTVDQIAHMYESAGVRLFARNVRGFLGDNQINRNLKKTIDTEPEYFWYYNNGITIVCDSALQESRNGNTVMRLENPQIINGQQTTRTLHACATKSSRAAVLVRVISVPRDTEGETKRFEGLVSQIVAATNWQNAVRASDLMANDRKQIELERNLRKVDYQYLRKRQSKTEAKKIAGVKHRFIITKEELAQVVAACDFDPNVVRGGKEQLFEERLYGTVFPNSDPNYYLPRYWLTKYVSSVAKGYPERGYEKWFIVHFVWNRLSPIIGTKSFKQLFRSASEKKLLTSMAPVVEAAFLGISSYYRANRGTGAKQVDASNFFNRVGIHKEFDKYMKSDKNKYMLKFDKAWNAFKKEFELLASS